MDPSGITYGEVHPGEDELHEAPTYDPPVVGSAIHGPLDLPGDELDDQQWNLVTMSFRQQILTRAHYKVRPVHQGDWGFKSGNCFAYSLGVADLVQPAEENPEVFCKERSQSVFNMVVIKAMVELPLLPLSKSLLFQKLHSTNNYTRCRSRLRNLSPFSS